MNRGPSVESLSQRFLDPGTAGTTFLAAVPNLPPSTRAGLRTYHLTLISTPGIGQVCDVCFAVG